jgi:RNA polymerase sigma factor (TIGR02999 family)
VIDRGASGLGRESASVTARILSGRLIRRIIIEPMNNVTRLLEAVEQGNRKAAEDLLPLVYDQLRKLAAHRMAQQPPGHTLQPTALVHEAWLKLVGGGKQQWESRKHFFSAAAEAMRHILIDRARKKQSRRRGGGWERVDVEAVEIAAPTDQETLLALNDALDQFEAVDPAKAEVVKLRFFVGLTERETAQVLGLSERTVQRHWAYAQAWLFERMSQR